MKESISAEKSILVTGAGGFIASHLLPFLARRRFRVIASTRKSVPHRKLSEGTCEVAVGELGPETDWSRALIGARIVVHLAGLAHVTNGLSPEKIHQCNVLGTLQLARSALQCGVKRFIYISSVKVMGDQSSRDEPWTESSPCHPTDLYAQSKLRAEEALFELAEQGVGMEIAVLRLPLVYGPGVKANMRTLMHGIRLGLPLPFRGIDNRRSLIGIDNLNDAILAAITHREAVSGIFLLSDGDDVSTPELVDMIAKAMRKKTRLFKVPESFLALASWTGKNLRKKLNRITGSLIVDSGKFRRMIGWNPPVSLAEGIESMVIASAPELARIFSR